MTRPAKQRRKDIHADLSDDSIRCRVNGHIWRPSNASKVVGAFETEDVCERCRSHRYSIISNRGEVRTRRIAYADHYLLHGERPEAADRDAMRLVVIKWDYGL